MNATVNRTGTRPLSTVHCPLWLAAATMLLGVPQPGAAQDDNPRLRWEYFYQQRAYPFATIPAGALQAARQELVQTWPNPFSAAPAMVSVTPWAQIGPERIPHSGTSTGRLTAIAVHPTDSDIIYVGGAQGGVWKTTNGGASWSPLTDQECSLAMGSIAIDPVNPNIVYAGTGEQHFSGDSYYGCGVLRSVDGGATWVVKDASPFPIRRKISRVVIDPSTAGSTTATTVFVATNSGLFRSTTSGEAWTDLQVGSGAITDLVMDPSNSAILYAAERGIGVYKTTDGGDTWEIKQGGFPTTAVGRINLAIAPSQPETLFASVHSSANNALRGIYTTANGAEFWTPVGAAGASCASQCWYDMTIAVHPTDATIVLFGGLSLYRSVNSGSTFSNVGNSIHVDQHILAFDPQNPSTVYVGNDGGIYKSTDAGVNWSTLNTNLAITQFYGGISLHPTDPLFALGGTQDNGTLQYNGSPDWSHVLGGDGGFTAVDREDPSVRYGETQWTSGTTFGGPRRRVGSSYIRKVNGINTSDRALFIPPLVMDPSDSHTLYFGTYRLYKTDDQAESWESISPDLTSGGRISAITVAPYDPDVIYVGASSGDVWVTSDGGGIWAKVDGSLPNRFITDITVDEVDWQIAYVTVSGFGSGHVFRTMDAGGSWQDVSANLPDVPVNAILSLPGSSSTLYLGTDLGAFVTNDAAVSWMPFNDGLPLVAIFDMAIEANTGVLLAGTHGRGMFTQTVVIPVSMRLSERSAVDTVGLGSTTPVQQSVQVRMSGQDAELEAWTTSHGASTWLTVTTPSGTGTDRVFWSKDPTGLALGTYVDTVTVTPMNAALDPVELVDTLVVDPPLVMTTSIALRVDTMVAGAAATVLDSAQVGFTGAGAGSAQWTATTASGAWISIANGFGVGNGVARWLRDASGLAAGVHVDTITVTSSGAGGSPAQVIDSLIVVPAIALTAAADELFYGGALTDLQKAFLDSQGNDDGVYNLGDVVRWIHWCGGSSPGGCIQPTAPPGADVPATGRRP